MVENIAGFIKQSHGSGGITGVMPGCLDVAVATLIELELAVANEVCGKFGDMNHLGGSSILEYGTGNR